MLPAAALLLLVSIAAAAPTYDIIVYGSTPAGIAASLIASRMGYSVALIEPGPEIGGMMVPGGIGLRDTADFASAFGNGSFSLAWAQLNGKHYDVPYVLQPDVVVGNHSLWTIMQNSTVAVFRNTSILEGDGGVTVVNKAIVSITTLNAATGDKVTWPAKVFVDASYDGDLAVGSGVSYTYGREANTTYDEPLAGVQPFNHFQNFLVPVNPYAKDGSVLPYVESTPLPPLGSADTKLMPFSYRACLTENVPGQLPFQAPVDYNPADFELLARYVASFAKPPTLGDLVAILPYGGPVKYPATSSRPMKYDLCEGGHGTNGQVSPLTTDQPDINDGYVTASRQGRLAVADKVRYFVEGFLYFLANDPSVPEATRNSTRSYGLCADSVPYWGPSAWPSLLYVREGVRIIGDYVATQKNVVKGECTPDAVASSSWKIDIHPMRRVAVKAADSPLHADTAMNEGQVGFAQFPGNGTSWEVRLAIMMPKKAEMTNLIVPVCLSASHVVYGSIRVEPTFVQIGQAAGIAAALAVRDAVAVQDVNVTDLQTIQRANGVEPHYPPGRCST